MGKSRTADVPRDSSDVAPSNKNTRAGKKPLAPTSRGSRQSATASNRANPPMISDVLNKAIDKMDVDKLRAWMKIFCKSDEKGTDLALRMQDVTCVFGKDVVRYSEGSDSEDSSENLGEEKALDPIGIGNNDLTPRFEVCLNCKQNFDITQNDRNDCVWHTGTDPLSS
jgi:hypothetical protein